MNSCGQSPGELLGLYGLYNAGDGYEEGDRAIVLRDYGNRYVAYEAKESIAQPAGTFTPALWDKICEVYPTGLDGLSLEGFDPIETGPYQPGDRALRVVRCGDEACVYEAVDTFTYDGGVPSSAQWTLLFCDKVSSGDNLCKPSPTCEGKVNRKAVALSASGDLACVPVESYLEYRADV